LERDPYNPQGWFVLGNCYFRMGVYDAAQIAFRQALMLDPQHDAARQNLELTAEMIRRTAA
jgi:cytochrome c-type biogenesis protein CcmH/NrfG